MQQDNITVKCDYVSVSPIYQGKSVLVKKVSEGISHLTENMKIEIRQVMLLSIFLNTDEKQELVSATFPSPLWKQIVSLYRFSVFYLSISRALSCLIRVTAHVISRVQRVLASLLVLTLVAQGNFQNPLAYFRSCSSQLYITSSLSMKQAYILQEVTEE